MQSNRVLTRKVLNTYLPVESRCGNLHIKVKDKEALHKILACISTDGNYKNFKSMSTWKTIAGFGGVAQEIFVKKIIFHKTKDKLRESLILPQKRYGYRSAVGECFNLITAEKRKLNTPRVLALIKKKRYFIDYEHHLIIESIPTSISLNTAISKNIISIDIAFDVISTAINELYNAKAIHLDFHLENIIINPKNPLDYKIIDLEFFDFLSNPLKETIPWHLAQIFQNRGDAVLEKHLMDNFAEKIITNYSKDQVEFISLYQNYSDWKTSTLKHERFWYEN